MTLRNVAKSSVWSVDRIVTMRKRKYLNQNCPVAQSLGVLGGQWTLLIARNLIRGINRFDGIQRNLNISRNLLAQRLKQMEIDGLVNKITPSGFKRSTYIPTEKCYDLVNILLSLSAWSEKWMPNSEVPKIRAAHPTTGKTLGLALVPINTIEKISPETLKIKFN